MTAPADQLRLVLQIERTRGFPDSAVPGGVDKMLRGFLEGGALPPGTPAHEALVALPAHGYGSLDATGRRRWAERVLRDLDPAPRPAGTAGREHPSLLPPSPTRREGDDAKPLPAARVARSGAAPAAEAGPPLSRVGSSPAPPPAADSPASGQTSPPSRVGKGAGGVGPSPPALAGTTAGAATPPKRPRAAAKPHPDGLAAPVTALPYVNSATAKKLERLEIRTVGDLLWHLPHRYDDFSRIRPVSELVPGEEQTVVGVVWEAREVTFSRFKRGTEAIIGDHTGTVRVIWFNQPWLVRELQTNVIVALGGKVTVFQGKLQMESPEWEVLEGDPADGTNTGRVLPVHPLTAGLSARTVRRLTREALRVYLPLVEDPLPEEARLRHALMPLAGALAQIHFPETVDSAALARARLAFDEVLTLQLAVLRRRAERGAAGVAPVLAAPPELIAAFHASLPFALTAAQQRVTADILAGLNVETPMARLVQGDVGSGKTVIAAAALLTAAHAGYQSALMAPTEILAEQHFRTLCRLFGDEPGDDTIRVCHPPYLDRPLRLALLRGGMGARAKRAVQQALAAGEVDIAVGTQALIQADVTIPRLALAVVDEQHRFGVAQRSALRGAEGAAHLMVMTATPIPRTLALTLYGDLDVSTIDEMPPGRLAVKTLVVQSHERDDAYNFIIEQLRAGRQAFVICPLVEESEVLEVRAATAEYEQLQSVFTSASLALLHGRMPPTKKDEIMRAFRDQLHDVLVSTAVVEVGIDIPNATVIMIEGAERFGLAQLHQFRGRVGRGAHQSYCFLMADGVSEVARERLHLMEEIADGFKLAEEDLRLRGEGDYFGTRQSGLPALKVASLADTPLLERARAEAEAALAPDPTLRSTPYAAYAPLVERILAGPGSDPS